MRLHWERYVRRTSKALVEFKTVNAERVSSEGSLIRQKGTLHEKSLYLILGTAMLGIHVHPKVVVTVESVLAGFIETSDMAACFFGIALARQGCQCRDLVGIAWFIGQAKSFAPLCL
jgi:hypothetical protein